MRTFKFCLTLLLALSSRLFSHGALITMGQLQMKIACKEHGLLSLICSSPLSSNLYSSLAIFGSFENQTPLATASTRHCLKTETGVITLSTIFRMTLSLLLALRVAAAAAHGWIWGSSQFGGGRLLVGPAVP
jgi:hypothetical protein